MSSQPKNDFIFHNLHDFLVETDSVNITCYNYLIFKKFILWLQYYAPTFNKNLKSPKKMLCVQLLNMKMLWKKSCSFKPYIYD